MTLNREFAILKSMKTLLLFLTLFSIAYPYSASAKCRKEPIKIAVIDSGFGFLNRGHGAKLCQYGHRDFTTDYYVSKSYNTKDVVPIDFMGHGTNIVGIIDSYLNKTKINYCIVIIKVFTTAQSGMASIEASIEAFQYANNINADYINYSGGGMMGNTAEKEAVEKFLDRGGHIVAAAGNENLSLDIPENAFYPAMYDKRIIVVGNKDAFGKRALMSNFGNTITRWEIGENITAYDITGSGTSQATAVATGKIIVENGNKCDRDL